MNDSLSTNVKLKLFIVWISNLKD